MARYLAIAMALAASSAFAMTPEQLLEAPRRGTAMPNPSGTHALFSYQKYSFDEQEWDQSMQLLDLSTGEITDSGLNASEVNEIVWIPGSETGVLYINGTNEEIPGGATMWMGDIMDPSSNKMVASLEAPFSGLKVANSSSGDLHFLVNTLAYPNGTAFNPEMEVEPSHTGRLYENIYPRHWDEWLTKQRYAVFGGVLSANSSYSLAGTGMRNFLQGVNFTTTRPECPIQPFGGSGDYDISPDGSTYAFLTKAPQLNKANFTASYVYIGPFDGSAVASTFNGPGSEAAQAGHKGASGAPTFSPDSSQLAYMQQDGDYYESDKWQLYVVDISKERGSVAASNTQHLIPNFDRSVGAIHWAHDCGSIYIAAEDYAINRIFHVPLSSGDDYIPTNLTSVTTVSDFSVLPGSSLLVSAAAVWTSMDYYTLKDGDMNMIFSAVDVDEELAGLGPHTYSEFFYDGSLPNLDQQLHSVIVKPSNFMENKTYPLAFIIHGGPQGSSGNGWSTRWNFQVWADQGYVVVAPNPTGSTGFGQYLIDAIQGEWGSYPYEDIKLAWKYVVDNLDYVDTEHGIAAGASYGGYMTNWIQSHDFSNEFKCLVTHDGISNTLAAFTSEELWFIRHDMNGTVGEPGSTYRKFNPMDHIANFSTPQFVIHNTLDYRLPVSDGLNLFNILQVRGIPSRFLNFPDENHWVLDVENSRYWHNEIFNWINHWSGRGVELDEEPIGE